MKKNLLNNHKKAIERMKVMINEGNFYLADGTALYYYLGHRKSLDLGFFTKQKVDFRHFKSYFQPEELKLISKDTIYAKILGINISFIFFPYIMIKDLRKFDSIYLASIEDILCMKINAIILRGSRKDFVDVYFIMKYLKINSYDVIKLYKRKFGNYNELIIRKVMTYFEDAEKEPEFSLIKKANWDEIKKFIIEEFSNL